MDLLEEKQENYNHSNLLKLDPNIEKNQENKIPTSSHNLSKLVKINAGGKEFVTYRSTLLKSDFLRMILEKKDMTVKIEGAIFIDENPTIFETVLDALRNGYSTMSYVTEIEKKYLQEKFEMYDVNVQLQNALHPINDEIIHLASCIYKLSQSIENTRDLVKESEKNLKYSKYYKSYNF